MVEVCRDVSSKYTRSKVRKTLPIDFAYIIQELLHENSDDKDKTDYISAIITTIITTGRADAFITAICKVIQQLVIDLLHILGDVYDRGPGAHIVMETLKNYHNWDITWGNHDILWMGAAAGNTSCICNVIRIALRYANMNTIEDGYGINLIHLATFAMDTYGNDPCAEFYPKILVEDKLDERNKTLLAQMHKAISVLQFKLESQLFERYPFWKMQDRELLKQVDYKKGTITLNGVVYNMRSCHFPTIDPNNPNALTPEEQTLIDRLQQSFKTSERLQEHIRQLLLHGRMYRIINHNLLYHASIPLTEEGKLKEAEIYPELKACGRELLHNIEVIVRRAFQKGTESDGGIDPQYAIDFFLYLWCGPESPLFDKAKMATFERYFIEDKETHKETKGAYFVMRDKEEIADMILDEFDVPKTNRHIINGHVPVHVAKGENPIKAGGKLMVIDGGLSEAYHKETGIAGYTLVFHSRGFQLVQHEPFTSAEDAIKRGTDIVSTTQIVEMNQRRIRVADTDMGTELRLQINALKELLYAYRIGFITEKESKNPPKKY